MIEKVRLDKIISKLRECSLIKGFINTFSKKSDPTYYF